MEIRNEYSGSTTPETIEQLQKWYEDRNLPPYEVTRFFIGINCVEPRAFGIYKEGNDFVVYKNKADGQRAIRYCGTDEAYAVNELYLRLKEEILNQKAHNQIRQGNDIEAGKSNKAKPSFVGGVVIKTLKILLGMAIFFVVIFAVAVLDEVYSGLPTTIVIAAVASIFVTIFMLCFMGERREKSQFCGRYINWIEKKNNFLHILIHYLICAFIIGLIIVQPVHNYCKIDYYQYNDDIYVNSRYEWYEYNGYDYYKVDKSDIPADMLNNKSLYGFDCSDSKWDNNITKFEDSGYYDEHYGSSDSDSDYDWNSDDSWDSNDTDWDSDW